MLTYILFFVGFILLIRGAEWLIDGASVLAQKIGISDLIVGLTVVAFGTSLPELIVNIFASSSDAGDLAIGNVLGSNIANILLIIGITAIIHPLTVHRNTVWREIIFNVMAACMLAVLVADTIIRGSEFSGLDKTDGIILMSYFVIFLYYTFGRTTFTQSKSQANTKTQSNAAIPNTVVKILIGATGLFFGGQWIVNGAIKFASLIGVSDAFIGLTIVAVGTSLPELAASIIAVRKKNVDIAVGNAVGSNLFNIFWVLGLSSFIKPLPFSDKLLPDVAMVVFAAAFLFGSMVVGRYRHQVSRPEGYVFVSLYVAYLAYAVYAGVISG